MLKFRNQTKLLSLAQVTTADFEGFCRKAAGEGILLRDITAAGSLTYSFQIRRRDQAVLHRICRARGDHLKLLRQGSFYCLARGLLRRPVLAVGILMLMFLFLFLPTRILFIRVSGNQTVPDLKILESAHDCGLRFLGSRRALRSEQIKNDLLEAIPDLSWVGINTRGSGIISKLSAKAVRKHINHLKV